MPINNDLDYESTSDDETSCEETKIKIKNRKSKINNKIISETTNNLTNKINQINQTNIRIISKPIPNKCLMLILKKK
jgi:hypothetical protein